ncbi:hypothetical protein EU98_2014 [Prochlorococcus marinus str. MIT 9314]|uniref:Uncharacterized protein n=1 Tax=Prochlorococcus marinus str. MIT 9314 TaxID=167548 RepID=A0A0A2AI33_PROMR|nr:hypothetical protein EU98_2014 [Prochlorococcus marinus str. MIT 9314]
MKLIICPCFKKVFVVYLLATMSQQVKAIKKLNAKIKNERFS